ncbi:MAG: hypothetical protein OEW83_18920, partial [Acidimicrobiia bacterium]|nr:hypothetical protein [Acidimicrobiia bacterium]
MPPADELNAPEPDRSPIVAALLSAIIPGLGHRRTRPTLARTLIGISLIAVLSFTCWLLTRDQLDLLAWTVKPNWLLGVVILSLVTLVARSAVTVDAARAAGLRHSRHPRLSRVSLLVVLVLVAAPHVAVTTLAWQQRILLTTVFTAEATTTARPTLLGGLSSNRSAGASLTPRLDGARISSQALPDISSEHVDDVDASASPAQARSHQPVESEPTTIPPSPLDPDPDPSIPDAPQTWDGEPRLSIVMLGSDGGYDRRGIRTDTIIVLSI